MIADAMSGKIDLIVTKSVSRFARNTVDSLVTILKEKGVEVYFEKENIYTFDGKGELLLTIMSSLAQLEQLRTTKTVRKAQTGAIGAFMFEVQELDALTEFDEKLWLTIIDTVTVHTDGRMTFRFHGGTEIET